MPMATVLHHLMVIATKTVLMIKRNVALCYLVAIRTKMGYMII